MNPKYPIYIISKGRSNRPLTIRALNKMNVPYRVVVEPQDEKDYLKIVPKEKLITLPFSNLGQGGIPARNFVWEHSIKEGHERHWIMDDNISAFFRMNDNMRAYATSGTIFKVMEDFVDRYKNIALAGPQYDFFAKLKDRLPAFYLNTRIYSCILIKNDLPYRWRGRYNEDTDLSIRALKDGWVTVMFYAFIQEKATTMTMKGGNTDELYKEDGRLKMAQSLCEQHPDVSTITKKFNRWQHQVNYKPFKRNRLIKKENITLGNKINEYGMKLISIKKSDGDMPF